jgi:hypothetical protein
MLHNISDKNRNQSIIILHTQQNIIKYILNFFYGGMTHRLKQFELCPSSPLYDCLSLFNLGFNPANWDTEAPQNSHF